MNTFSEQIWDMIKRSRSYGRKNEVIWISIPIIKTRFEIFEGLDQEIGSAVQNQKDNDPGGHVIEKQCHCRPFKTVISLGTLNDIGSQNK